MGTTQEETVWFRVSVWQQQAEACNQYLSKGQRVLVVGEMREPGAWTDQEGNARASLEVRGAECGVSHPAWRGPESGTRSR